MYKLILPSKKLLYGFGSRRKELLAKNLNAESLIQKQDLTSVEIED